MQAYSEAYLGDVVVYEGKLFDFVAQNFPDKDTADFIQVYMNSKTRKSIDEGQAYVNTMDNSELWNYFCKTDGFTLQKGDSMIGFVVNSMLTINGITIFRAEKSLKTCRLII